MNGIYLAVTGVGLAALLALAGDVRQGKALPAQGV